MIIVNNHKDSNYKDFCKHHERLIYYITVQFKVRKNFQVEMNKLYF